MRPQSVTSEGSRLARGAWRRARARVAPGALILLYHRVAVVPSDPYRLCVSPEHFDAHLAELARRGVLIPLTDLVDGLAAGQPPGGRVAVTFDDGYADNAAEALASLVRHDAPATMYVTTDVLDAGTEFWWDELQAVVDGADAPQAVLAAALGVADRPDAGPGDLLARAHGRLRDLPPAARADELAAIRARTGWTAAVRPSHRPLTWDEVRVLAATDLIEVGSHGATHSRLAELPAHEQRVEVARSADRLAAELGSPVRAYSYAHGSCSENTGAAVAAEGFEHACATAATAVRPGADRWRLPRITVGDVDGAAFARALGHWLGM